MTWLLARQHTPIHLPDERLTPAEAIIISRSGHTEESWNRLTPQQRAEIRWNLGTGGAV